MCPLPNAYLWILIKENAYKKKKHLVPRHVGSSISLLISVFSIRDSIPFFEQYNRLKSPRSSFPFFKRIRITAAVTDVARLEHAETITRYRFLPRTLPCSFPLAFPLLFEWFGFYRSLVKACFHPPPPTPPPILDFLHSCTRRQWALFTKDSVLAVVLMPFQAICTFVASFPIPSPAPSPPPHIHHHSDFTLVSLQFLYRQSWMSFPFLCKEYLGWNERLRHNTFHSMDIHEILKATNWAEPFIRN